jgi:hypothetical protein
VKIEPSSVCCEPPASESLHALSATSEAMTKSRVHIKGFGRCDTTNCGISGIRGNRQSLGFSRLST